MPASRGSASGRGRKASRRPAQPRPPARPRERVTLGPEASVRDSRSSELPAEAYALIRAAEERGYLRISSEDDRITYFCNRRSRSLSFLLLPRRQIRE